MYGDFSRLTFNPVKGYTAVLKQQGRVELDADANESTAILLNGLRLLAADVIGRHGGPDDGFKLEKAGQGLKIIPGVYYVNGIRVESRDRADGSDLTYANQPFAFFAEGDNERNIPLDKPLLLYLKVWEQSRSAVEEPAIREKALGIYGPDTTLRTRLVWQVKWIEVVFKDTVTDEDKKSLERITLKPTTNPNNTYRLSVEEAFYQWTANLQRSAGTLAARVERPDDTLDDPCVLDPNSRYRGLENHLYRVEVHSPGTITKGVEGFVKVEGLSFKWSRDNGSVVFPILEAAGRELTVGGLGRDERCSLAVGDWVEVVDDAYLARGKALPLRQVTEVDFQESRVVLDAEPEGNTGADPARAPLLRRWDQRPLEDPEEGRLLLNAADNAARVEDGGWLNLEHGIQVRFDEGRYSTGDYWLIPARVFDGSIEWPVNNKDEAAAIPPHGPAYRCAPLALNTGDGSPVSLRRKIAQAPFA